jgi:hypothetical protein
LAEVGEQDARSSGTGEGPASFLDDVANELRKAEHVDLALAEILAQHLLTAAPVHDAVAKAKELILNLARKRAMSTSETGNA